MRFEISDIDEDESIVSGEIKDAPPELDLESLAYEYLSTPAPGTACTEQLCPVETPKLNKELEAIAKSFVVRR